MRLTANWRCGMGAMRLINRFIGLLYMRLTRECPACRGYGTFNGVLYDSVEEMLAGPLPPECPACGGSGRVWKWRRR